jgi:hypothetical protein
VKIAKSTDNLTLTKANLAAADPTPVTPSAVRYAISLKKVYDRISVRATNLNAVETDASGVAKAAIYVLPTPVTQPIKHIKSY